LDTFAASIAALPDGTLWRHNQAGDLPGIGDTIDSEALRQLVKANNGKRGFTYTHKPLTPENAALIREANESGFTVNLSGNNPAHADTLADTNAGPVVTVMPSDSAPVSFTPKGRRIVICPAQTRDNITCATCQLCARRDRSGVIVGFLAHGTGHKKASLIAKGN
jgi:hypothetical protein